VTDDSNVLSPMVARIISFCLASFVLALILLFCGRTDKSGIGSISAKEQTPTLCCE
jgi:hypothetical protein